ncbi:hypothetical protein LTR56_003130 [Elasticomyces elasticus]|nr:hypothetical protein LTR22_014350 [Elasticomyces elasticus]KAK3656427.1 hypothetical protein LTR56_003130 [Elasticomyces elasticus]KAK4910527.1 hypothetical protein LTR49_020793 [Elasticomyces elasticus]KAK5750163.1 hypothetical protein LTS12_019813 [Elasticomyces elasticus]
MSYLGVDDRASRTRSKSGTRDRSRSRSAVRVESPPRKTSGYSYAPPTPSSQMPGSFDTPTAPSHEVRTPNTDSRSNYFPQTTGGARQYPPSGGIPYPADDGFTMGDYTDFPPHERPGYVPPRSARFPSQPRHEDDDDDLAYGAESPVMSRHASYSNATPRSPETSRHASYSGPPPSQSRYPGQHDDRPTGSDYRYTPQAPASSQAKGTNGSYQYAQPPDKITYTAKPQTGQSRQPSHRHETSPDITLTRSNQMILARLTSRLAGIRENGTIVVIHETNEIREINGIREIHETDDTLEINEIRDNERTRATGTIHETVMTHETDHPRSQSPPPRNVSRSIHDSLALDLPQPQEPGWELVYTAYQLAAMDKIMEICHLLAHC